MSGDFRLRIPLWGSFVFVWCVVFNQGCCVFVQYNLLKGCCEWILIQPWTQVIDYSLPGLTWHTRLRIGISHLSISGIVVHGRCYFSHCFYFSVIFLLLLLLLFFFYDCLLIGLCFLFLFFCCFISYLCYCICYHFILLFIPRNLLSQKCKEKTNSFILFSL